MNWLLSLDFLSLDSWANCSLSQPATKAFSCQAQAQKSVAVALKNQPNQPTSQPVNTVYPSNNYQINPGLAGILLKLANLNAKCTSKGTLVPTTARRTKFQTTWYTTSLTCHPYIPLAKLTHNHGQTCSLHQNKTTGSIPRAIVFWAHCVCLSEYKVPYSCFVQLSTSFHCITNIQTRPAFQLNHILIYSSIQFLFSCLIYRLCIYKKKGCPIGNCPSIHVVARLHTQVSWFPHQPRVQINPLFFLATN